MPRCKDVLWEHIVQDGRKVKCKFCHEVFVGGITRMRYHFANTCSKDIRPCKCVPDSVRDIALKGVQELESKSKRRKITRYSRSGDSSLGLILQSGNVSVDALQVYNHLPKPGRHKKGAKTIKPTKSIISSTRNPEFKAADKAIVKYIVSSDSTFDILMSSDFHEACIAIANAGPEYEPPSSERACGRLLAELKEEANAYVHSVKRMWEKSGCSLMLDSTEGGNNMSYLHLLAASPKGVVYLKSLCLVAHTKDDQHIFDFITSVIDEIEPQNVVQFISDNLNYESVGHMIEQKYPNIFRVNCARYCIVIMLKELYTLSHVSLILEGAKKIVHFVCKHQHVWNLMKSHTDNGELRRPCTTRFLTDFVYLQFFLKEEKAFHHIASTMEWKELTPCQTVEGVEVQNMINDAMFWDCVKELMHAVEPLVKILRMVDGGGSTSGYIYDALHKAKKTIREVYGDDFKYLQFWEIIDDKWNKLLYREIHAAAAYLNPHLFHDGHVKLDSDIKVGLEKVIQRMVSNNEDRMKIAEELRDYHSLDPRIFGPMAVDSLHVSHPRIWWDMWGSAVPILQSLAIKILSQPCTFLSCEKNLNALEGTHTKKRDHLETIRLQDLLYVRMNMHQMKTTLKMEKADVKPIDLNKIEAFLDDLEETTIHEDGENIDDEEDDELGESEGEAGSSTDANAFGRPRSESQCFRSTGSNSHGFAVSHYNS